MPRRWRLQSQSASGLRTDAAADATAGSLEFNIRRHENRSHSKQDSGNPSNKTALKHVATLFVKNPAFSTPSLTCQCWPDVSCNHSARSILIGGASSAIAALLVASPQKHHIPRVPRSPNHPRRGNAHLFFAKTALEHSLVPVTRNRKLLGPARWC